MKKKFQRHIENFACKNCGAQVQGDGFTNHCPHCLWSRHVDIQPGDRAAECCGMMAPVAVQKRGDAYRISHRCQECGLERWNKSASADGFDLLVELARSMGRN